MLLRFYILIILLFPFQNTAFAASADSELETISLIDAVKNQAPVARNFFERHPVDQWLLRRMHEMLTIMPFTGSLLFLFSMNRRFSSWWDRLIFPERAICLRS